MSESKQINNPQILAAFYSGTVLEIQRLRDERWRFSYYFIAEGTGVILLFADGKLDKYINYYMLLTLLFVQALCVAFYLVHMYINHRYLDTARNVRRRLERFFGLHELRLDDGQAVMPEQWKPLRVSPYFELDSVVLPLALFVIGVQVTSIYIVARVFAS
jgi:hypothetical protein